MPTVYCTAPRDVAQELAERLVTEQLAACVNIVECTSTYRWEGDLRTADPEAILLAKTTADRYPELKARLEEVHPYDVPCIERFDEHDVSAPFAEWIATEVQ